MNINILDIFPQITDNILFNNVDKNKISKLLCGNADDISLKKYFASEIILSPDIETIPIGIVIDGIIEITSATQKHKVILKTAGKGAMFGIANLYATDSEFPSQITAKTDSEILMINPNLFKKIIESDPVIMKNYLYFLSNKILYLNKKISSYTIGNTDCKLSYYLYENEVDGVVRLNNSLSDISVMLNMGRASLYRSLDKLIEENIICKDGKNIYIIDKEKLKNYI